MVTGRIEPRISCMHTVESDMLMAATPRRISFMRNVQSVVVNTHGNHFQLKKIISLNCSTVIRNRNHWCQRPSGDRNDSYATSH